MLPPETLTTTSLYARLVDDLREAELTNGEIATIVGVRPRQVQHWASGAHRPQGRAKDRLLELHYIVDRLRDVYTPEGIDVWIHGRNRGLDSRKPIELLNRGQFQEVLDVVDQLTAGSM